MRSRHLSRGFFGVSVLLLTIDPALPLDLLPTPIEVAVSVARADDDGGRPAFECRDGNERAAWHPERFDCWYDPEWEFRKKIRISGDLTASDLDDFPVLIATRDGGNEVFHKAQPGGHDILFTDSDGATKLDHELEVFDARDGRSGLVAHVRIPKLCSSSDRAIFVYYGNTGAVSGWTAQKKPDNPISPPGSRYAGDFVRFDGAASDRALAMALKSDDQPGAYNTIVGAYSADGGDSWSRSSPRQPLLPRGRPWAFDEMKIQSPTLFYDPDTSTYHLYYLGTDRDFVLCVGHATTRDLPILWHLGSWTKDANNPLLCPADAGDWKDEPTNTTHITSMIERDGVKHFFFFAGHSPGGGSERTTAGSIGYVRADDWSWETPDVHHRAILERGEYANEIELSVLHPSVFRHDGAFYMLYEAVMEGTDEGLGTGSEVRHTHWAMSTDGGFDTDSWVRGPSEVLPLGELESWDEDRIYGAALLTESGSGHDDLEEIDGVYKLTFSGYRANWNRGLQGIADVIDIPTATRDQQNVYGVWDSAYQAVHHFNMDDGVISDSTRHENNGDFRNQGEDGHAAGKIGGALALSRDSHVGLGASPSVNIDGSVTLEAWVYPQTTKDASIVALDSLRPLFGIIGNRGYSLAFTRFMDGMRFAFSVVDASRRTRTIFSDAVPIFMLQTWHHVVGVHDASADSLVLYVDGEPSRYFSAEADPIYNPGQEFAAELSVGAGPGNRLISLEGRIDELRISDVARSRDWIESSYRIQSAPGAYVTFADEERVSGVTACDDSRRPRRFGRFPPSARPGAALGRRDGPGWR